MNYKIVDSVEKLEEAILRTREAQKIFATYTQSEVDKIFDFAIDFAEKQSEYNILMNPSPIYSSSFNSCLQKGRDVHEYSVKYNNRLFWRRTNP